MPRVRAGERRQAVCDRAARAFGAGRDLVARLRLPHLSLLAAAIVGGTVAGLVAVGLSSAALALFSWWLGVAAGGGWGFLAFCLIAVASAQVGARILRAFGHQHPTLLSYLGIILTIIVLLVLLLDVVESRWAVLVLPTIAASTFAAAHGLVLVAESQEEPFPDN